MASGLTNLETEVLAIYTAFDLANSPLGFRMLSGICGCKICLVFKELAWSLGFGFLAWILKGQYTGLVSDG